MWGYIAGFSAVFTVSALLFARRIAGKLNSIKSDPELVRREEKLFKLFDELEGMMNSFEEYVGEVHTELEQKRAELTELSQKASTIYAQIEDRLSQTQPPKEQEADSGKMPANKKSARLGAVDRKAVNGFATKPQKIRFLMSRGFSLDEVARELDIGKGEVKLIVDLDK